MDVDPKEFMVMFLCIDYTIWPGWNHRGVYVLSRTPTLQVEVCPCACFMCCSIALEAKRYFLIV